MSLAAVAATFFNECFEVNKSAGEYEDALCLFGKAAALYRASFNPEGFGLSGELDPSQAVHSCERLYRRKSAVKDWGKWNEPLRLDTLS